MSKTITTRAFTLRKLAQLLNELVEANEASGHGDRNDLPVVFEIERWSKWNTPLRSKFVPVSTVSGAPLTQGGEAQATSPCTEQNNARVMTLGGREMSMFDVGSWPSKEGLGT